jgi:RNA polymerase subunit RPABC4/transcription elongation factor Spt4
MKFKCPECRSTDVSRKFYTCTCNKCGEKWELSVKETERLLKEDKTLVPFERSKLQKYIKKINKELSDGAGRKVIKLDFTDPVIAQLHRTMQNITQSMLMNHGFNINKTDKKSAVSAKEESIKAAPVAVKTDEPQRDTETIRQTVPDTANGKSVAPVKTDEPRLITCRVCKKDVSSEAASCPHCGDPYITEEKKQAAITAAEKAKRESEAAQKRAYIYQLSHEFRSSKNGGSCPACGARKRWEFSDYNESGFYYQGCNWTTDDICKTIYGVTMNEL